MHTFLKKNSDEIVFGDEMNNTCSQVKRGIVTDLRLFTYMQHARRRHDRERKTEIKSLKPRGVMRGSASDEPVHDNERRWICASLSL